TNALITPAEEVLRADSHRQGLEWTSSPSYDLVEMNQPEAGSWQMVGAHGEPADGVAVVKDSALTLAVRLSSKDVPVDDALQLQAELVEEGQRVRNYSRLKAMKLEAKVEGVDGYSQTVPFSASKDPGLYSADIRHHVEGRYRLQVTALSPTLQRQWQGSYSVGPARVELDSPTVVLSPPNREPWLELVAIRLAYINVPLLAIGLIGALVYRWSKKVAP
ncbi:MAG: hypothetical protein AAF449_02305, partial [Myxococcota bacterium]